MIVQIYEVTTPAEARALGAMGVDHIGVLIGEGSFPREQTIEKARELFAAIPAGSKASVLSLSHDVDLIVRLAAALLPDILHLGAAPQHLSPAQLRTLKGEFPQVLLMRSISGKLCDIECLSIICRAADAAVVRQDQFVGTRQSINERRIPVCTRRTEPIQHQKQPALPDSAISDSSAINLDHWQRLSFHRRQNSTISSVALRHEKCQSTTRHHQPDS